MEEDAKDLIVLGAINNGVKQFNKISTVTKIKPEELNNILETILYGRNIKKEDFDDFLDPKVNNLIIDPNELVDMDNAIKEIR